MSRTPASPTAVAAIHPPGGTATGTLLAAAAIATAAPGKAWAKPETKEERKKSRYKESDHVKRYYQTNRY